MRDGTWAFMLIFGKWRTIDPEDRNSHRMYSGDAPEHADVQAEQNTACGHGLRVWTTIIISRFPASITDVRWFRRCSWAFSCMSFAVSAFAVGLHDL